MEQARTSCMRPRRLQDSPTCQSLALTGIYTLHLRREFQRLGMFLRRSGMSYMRTPRARPHMSGSSRRSRMLYTDPQDPRREDPPYGLSQAEQRVLTQLADGLSDKEIALKLGASRFTINKHVTSILAKM